MVCKPGSVPGQGYPRPGGDHSSTTRVTARLKRPYPGASGGPPAPCSVLLRVGFAGPTVAGGTRGLLPHVFTLARRLEGLASGLFSVALSLGLTPTGSCPAPCPAEPGLSSCGPGHPGPPAAARPPRPTSQLYHLESVLPQGVRHISHRMRRARSMRLLGGRDYDSAMRPSRIRHCQKPLALDQV